MADATRHPWILGNLSVTRDVIARVDEEARAAYGREEESCGFLVGPADPALFVDTIVPMKNRANDLHAQDPVAFPRTGRMYFDIDPLKFDRAVREHEKQGRPVKVLYHSHLDVGAYFSETDAQAATMGGEEPAYDLAYLVTSVRGDAGSNATVDERKLFIWDRDKHAFVESPLVVVD